MTNAIQPKKTPTPALFVYGRLGNSDVPQASWFCAEDRPAVLAAAKSLKLSVLDIQTEAEKALALGISEGVLKGNGRMIVGSVTPEVYGRIEKYVAGTQPVSAAAASSDAATEAKSVKEQNKNATGGAAASEEATKTPTRAGSPDKPVADSSAAPAVGKPTLSAPSDPWDALRVGSHVVSKYWDEEGEAAGWWVGIVTGLDGEDFVIVWLDDPNRTPPFKVERKHVAVLHPTFDVKREWDPRR